MSFSFQRCAQSGLLATLLVLTGCASMTEEECLTADWYERGLHDGRNGQPQNYLAQHFEACSKVGVVPREDAWNKGHARGITDYCTPENGARMGRQGHSYRNSCPAHLESAFLAQYRPAYRVYQAEQHINSLNSSISSKERELDREKNEDKRRKLRRELHDLDDRLRRARNDLYRAEREMYRY